MIRPGGRSRWRTATGAIPSSIRRRTPSKRAPSCSARPPLLQENPAPRATLRRRQLQDAGRPACPMGLRHETDDRRRGIRSIVMAPRPWAKSCSSKVRKTSRLAVYLRSLANGETIDLNLDAPEAKAAFDAGRSSATPESASSICHARTAIRRPWAANHWMRGQYLGEIERPDHPFPRWRTSREQISGTSAAASNGATCRSEPTICRRTRRNTPTWNSTSPR